MTGQLFSSSRLKLASCLFDGSCAVQVELSSRQLSTNVMPVRRSRQKEKSGVGEGVEERGEEEQGKEKRRKEKENKGGKRKGSQGKEKRRRKKEKQERGRKKQAAAISKQVGPQLPLGSMPSAHGGSLCFKGVAPCGEGDMRCSHVSDGQRGAPPETGVHFLALGSKSKGIKESSKI
jgi:hypothetical protein